MNRDRELEGRLLEATGGSADYVNQVLARLDHFEAKHGNASWDRPVDQLLQELQEEAADITGWGRGVALQLDGMYLPRLVVPMRLGAVAWREARDLREVLAAVAASEDRRTGV